MGGICYIYHLQGWKSRNKSSEKAWGASGSWVTRNFNFNGFPMKQVANLIILQTLSWYQEIVI